ncbi:unnamed protein product [Paramecium sonneborni]|uniref:Uncharacterized protein n=1 Tax=Paramecium sonneborni TaxID=65129 RepID=A0A8S1N2G3_9CILI|nr:unnamed protein product [Paramecium sonneborni]
MNEIMRLQQKSKKQNLELNILWEQLAEMQIKFKQRNKSLKKSQENRFSYLVFVNIIPFLYLHEILKLRLLSSYMKEIITNYLLNYRLEKLKVISQLEMEINEEKEKLPIIYYEILEDLIKRSNEYTKQIFQLNIKGVKLIQTYTPLFLMQVSECEGIELFRLIPEELMKMTNHLIFLDFSKYTDEKRNQLLEIYENKLQITSQMEQQMNTNDKFEIIFARIAKMWLKQTYYQETYNQFRLIMILIKRKENIGQFVRQLEKLDRENSLKQFD